MIVCHNKFVIATPSKCGTHSFKALAKRVDGMEWINTMHLMEVPDEFAHLDRILIVRNPYDRLYSIYQFLLRNKSQWGSREVRRLKGKKEDPMTFGQFVKWFIKKREEHLHDPKATSRRAPWLWLWNCSENYDILTADLSKPERDSMVTYWHLEEADECLLWLKDVYSIDIDRDTMYRGNSADSVRGEKGSTWKLDKAYRGKEVTRLVTEEYAGADCRRFGYEIRR